MYHQISIKISNNFKNKSTYHYTPSIRSSYMINGPARRGSNMFENYSEEDYDTYNALREQSIKPNIARMYELGLTNGLGPIVYDPVLFMWYFDAFKIGVQNSLELLMCSIDEKTRGIQIILANNLSLPKHKMEEWIRKLEFEILYPNLPDECKNLFNENPTYETFINRLSNDF